MIYGSVCSGIAAGQKFGRLVVVAKVPKNRCDQWRWRCRCECGNEIIVTGSRLKNGCNKSCGCLRRDRTGGLYRTHGKSQTLAYCMFYDARKRALAFGLPFTIEPEDIKINSVCPVLGIPLSEDGNRNNRPSLDRAVPSRGYTPSNIYVISFRANRIKSDASIDELKKIVAYMEAA